MKKFNDFVNELKYQLDKPLPGFEAQIKMTSIDRSNESELKSKYSEAKKGAVLILFYPYKNSIYTVFILRQEYEGVHSGQISFPGGRFEDFDKSLINTALREAKEEVGVDISKVKVLGSISRLYIPPSNFLVQPVIGITYERPDFCADNKEVKEILEIEFLNFLNDKNIDYKEITVFSKLKITAPCYNINGKIIWGATAMILSELCEILR
jgi:8-oxo-dGTP pyrophosphatase MutT (NUDIX family)